MLADISCHRLKSILLAMRNSKSGHYRQPGVICNALGVEGCIAHVHTWMLGGFSTFFYTSFKLFKGKGQRSPLREHC